MLELAPFSNASLTFYGINFPKKISFLFQNRRHSRLAAATAAAAAAAAAALLQEI